MHVGAMRCLLATAGLVLALSTGAATADEMSGSITQIDRETGAVTVNGETFYISESTYGSALDDLSVGEYVSIFYLPISVDETYDAVRVTIQDRRPQK